MQRIFSAIGEALAKRLLIFGLISLLNLSGLFVFANQPALADVPSRRPSEEAIDRAYTMSEATGLREEARQEAYDEAAEAINDPRGLDKIYNEDLKAFKQETSDENGGLLEGAKDLVDKITGNE
jgi:hypothetical protein